MYQNIPMELRQRQQWVCAGPDKIPLNPRTGERANVQDPGTWGSFEDSIRSGMRYIGFVFTPSDPYCGIDLDSKMADEREFKLHERILAAFDSYTERSASGKGYHIIVKASLPHGRRRDSVEVYSSGRFFIFTGNVVRSAPITEQQERIELLVAEMPTTTDEALLENVESRFSDAEIHEIARTADNAAKYDELCAGRWEQYGYPSQSEADFALLSIIAFYTKDNEQVRRIFRCTQLGKREKAMRDDRYLNTALRKIRAHEPTLADLDQIKQDAERFVAETRPVVANRVEAPKAPPAPAHNGKAHPLPAHAPPAPARAFEYSLTPPGLVGEIASYVYDSSVRPVREVALLAALGFVAGIAGRCYNISNTGLNQYLLLVAETGIGKEDGPKGIDRLIAAVRPRVPMVDEFIGPGKFASGQAIIRVLDKKPCFLSVLGEFGLTLQALNDPRAPAVTLILKQVLLDLYAKSGWNNVLRNTAYSDTEKNTHTVFAPSMSFVGDTTPETFFDALSSSDIADGLIPRLHVLDYKGERPARNRKAGAPPDAKLAARVEDLVALSLTCANNSTCANVSTAGDALSLLDAFDAECDAHINGATGITRHLWNRAHLKALKVAALLAVGCDLHSPTITHELATWAIEFTRRGTEALLGRFEKGEVGNGEQRQEAELKRLVEEYFKMTPKQLGTYRSGATFQDAGLVPYFYLSARASRLACFTNDRRGARNALQDVLKDLAAKDVLVQADKAQVLGRYSRRDPMFARSTNF